MGINTVKDKIKEILSIDVIDLESEINTKGNYIYLSGFTNESANIAKFEFTLILADKNFKDDTSGLETTLDSVLSDVVSGYLNNTLDIKASSGKIKKTEDLFMYEIKLHVEAEIITE